MSKKNKLIVVKGTNISVSVNKNTDYISLTDIARYKDSKRTDYVIQNWMRNRNTIEFLGIWESLYNSDFNPIEFEGFKNKAGLNSFVLTPKQWIEKTNAKGLISKAGRYGGTYAFKDIAFEFASWVSVEFKLYLIKEFQRLKEEENNRLKLEWNIQRTLAKVNYHIHTDAIKENLIPKQLNKKEINFIYASEADLLNMALFGKTAKQWRVENPNLNGNIRDYASLEQLVVLSNLESINSLLIRQNITQPERLRQLNQIAIQQMKSLLQNKNLNKLKNL